MAERTLSVADKQVVISLKQKRGRIEMDFSDAVGAKIYPASTFWFDGSNAHDVVKAFKDALDYLEQDATQECVVTHKSSTNSDKIEPTPT